MHDRHLAGMLGVEFRGGMALPTQCRQYTESTPDALNPRQFRSPFLPERGRKQNTILDGSLWARVFRRLLYMDRSRYKRADGNTCLFVGHDSDLGQMQVKYPRRIHPNCDIPVSFPSNGHKSPNCAYQPQPTSRSLTRMR